MSSNKKTAKVPASAKPGIILYRNFDKTKLSAVQINNIKKLCQTYADKIAISIHNEFNLIVDITEYSKEGNRHKYSFYLKLTAPMATVSATKGNGDWDVERSLHKSFKNLERELGHKLREGSSYRKDYE